MKKSGWIGIIVIVLMVFWESRYSFLSGGSNGIWNAKTSFEKIEQQIVSEGIELSGCKHKDVSSQDFDAVGAKVAEFIGKNPNGSFLECYINNEVIRIYKCIESSVESNISDKIKRLSAYNCDTINFINQGGRDDEFVKSESGDFILFFRKNLESNTKERLLEIFKSH